MGPLLQIPNPKLARGAVIVETLSVRQVQRLGREVMDTAGILLVDGEPGMGKTTATIAFARTVNHPVAWMLLASGTSGRSILTALTQWADLDSTGTSAVLLERLVVHLAEHRVLIVVDEAHLLNVDALRYIRFLYDQTDSRMALVLIGSDFTKAWKKAPELRSRVTRHVRVGRLEGSDLISRLQAHHPMLASTAEELLREIDASHCHGDWRSWMEVLARCLRIGMDPSKGITWEGVVGTLGVLLPSGEIQDERRRRKGRRTRVAAA